MGAFPVTIQPTPQGYDFQEYSRGDYGGYYNGAHYLFLFQGGFDSPGGDLKIHALKSSDGVTWTEMDAANAPTPPSAAGYGAGYTVSKPDGNTIWLAAVTVVGGSFPLFPGPYFSGFQTITYDLSTDTWGSFSSLITSPVITIWGGQPGLPAYMTINIIIRGTNDYLFLFNGPLETVGGTTYGRVYVCSFDGTTFGTPVMISGQAGNALNYFAFRGSVDSANNTHFLLFSAFGSTCEITHVVMASGAPGTFGSVTTVTVNAIPDDVGYFSEPSIDFVGGIETISFVGEITDPLTSNAAWSFFAGVISGLGATWTADPGIIITEDPTLVGTNVGYFVFDISLGIAYSNGVYYFSFLVSNPDSGPPDHNVFDGRMYLSTSADGGNTWTTPVELWAAPVIGTSTITAEAQQMLSYSYPGGVAILGLFTAWDTEAEIAQFYAISPVVVSAVRRPLLQYRRPFHSGIIKSQ